MVMRNTVAAALLLIGIGGRSPVQAGGPGCGAWEVVPTPMPAQADRALVRDIVALAPNDVWAVGDWSGTVDGYYQTFALALHWDGSAWTVVDIPQPAPCDVCNNTTLWAIDATGPDDVWAAGGALRQAPDGFVGTHTVVMHWDGSSWTVLDTPIQGGGSGDVIWGLDAITPDDVWFFGDGHPIPVQPQPALAMHWDGSGFEIFPLPQVNDKVSGFGNGNSLRAGSALSADDIWAVGAAGDGDSLTCDKSQILHWNGSQWEHVPAGPPDNCVWHDLEAVVAIGADDVWAGGDSFDSNYHGLAIHWNGETWVQAPTPIGIRDFVAFATDDVWAVGGGIAHWNGETWTLVETFPEVFGPTFAGASAAGSCEIWAGGRQIDESDRLVPLIVRLVPGALGDLDGDGCVGQSDLGILLGDWGCTGTCAGDLDNSGDTGQADLGILLGNWSAGC